MQSVNHPQAGASVRKGLLVATLGSMLLVTGCQSAAGTGALAGGALGAGIGTLAGGRHPGNAALAGGLIGATVGGLTGAAVDEHKAKEAAKAAAASAPSLEQIADMTRNQVGDVVIINQIRQARVRYNLSPDQIVWLKQNGVSSAVITEMQAAYYPARVVYEVPPPEPRLGVGVVIRR